MVIKLIYVVCEATLPRTYFSRNAHFSVLMCVVCACVCYGPTGRGVCVCERATRTRDANVAHVRDMCVCYGPTGRGTRTGHASGVCRVWCVSVSEPVT